MYCSKCGSKIENDERFCGNCGAPVNNGNFNQQYQENNYYTQPQTTNHVNKLKNPWELFIDAWKNTFNYQGVTSRRGFWWFMLIQIGVILLSVLLATFISGEDSLLVQFVLTVTYLPIIAAGSRRMRDTNKSIWWAILSYALAWFFQPFMVGYYVSNRAQLLVGIISIVFIVFACQRTKNTENRERIN